MVNCYKCNKQITNPKDVNVVAFLGLIPRKLCNNCYSSKERGLWRGFYFPHTPLNSVLYTISLIVATIILSIALIVVIFGGQISDTSNVSPEIGKLMIISLIVLVLVWQWILFIIARITVNEIKRNLR